MQKRYVTLAALSDAWSTTLEQLGSFNSVPLPSIADLRYTRYGNMMQVRAIDYNLFAQDMFSRWVKSMVETIRATGSTQLVDVGQDEGGVTDRVLNQFYGAAGLSFTTNHTTGRMTRIVGLGRRQKTRDAEYHRRNRLSASLGT